MKTARRAILLLCFALFLRPAAKAEIFSYETLSARYEVGSDGRNRGLWDKATGHQWLSLQDSPFARVKKGNQYFAVSSLKRNGDALHATFGKSGVEADYQVIRRGDYWIIKLAALAGDGIQEIELGHLNTPSLTNAGALAVVRCNDTLAISLTGLSDRVDCRLAGGDALAASVYPEYGMVGEAVAVLAVPAERFVDVVQRVEQENHLPSPRIGGRWAKRSFDVRTSYLFTDLTEANVNQTISYAKLGGFRYILIYSSTWARSLGSYPINTNAFPHGEAGLRATITRCHEAGLKVGMHMLTSLVSKDDPWARAKPTSSLLRDAEATLDMDVGETNRSIRAVSGLASFSTRPSYYYASPHQGTDIQIDKEIIHYTAIGGALTNEFVGCVRGYAGTPREAHHRGARVFHLVERYGCYLADLQSPLKDELAQRIAGLIDRCGFDMIYFDGGELSDANGPFWYWASQQQMAVWKRVHRDLLVQGSGITPWTWHIFCRGNCDDYVELAPKQYLDIHKIADSWEYYYKSFMPAELGWWGFLANAPDHPATKPDDVEYYAARMLALDTPVSLETTLATLSQNGRTKEMLGLLGRYEKLRLANRVPRNTCKQLQRGEWHLIKEGLRSRFHLIQYDSQRVIVPGRCSVHNRHGAQPLKFRLQAVSVLGDPNGSNALVLLQANPPAELNPPGATAVMHGALATNVDFSKPLDLLHHRSLAVTLRVEGATAGRDDESPFINIQLEGRGKTYRDYFIHLDFSGERTITVTEPTAESMLPRFRPVAYAYIAAARNFDYGAVVGLNIRWMRVVNRRPVQCWVSRVVALGEQDAALEDPEIRLGASAFRIPATLETGQYAEYWGGGKVHLFDADGHSLGTQAISTAAAAVLAEGENRFELTSQRPAAARIVIISLGEAR